MHFRKKTRVFGIETQNDLGRKKEKMMVFLGPSRLKLRLRREKKKETHNGDFFLLSRRFEGRERVSEIRKFRTRTGTWPCLFGRYRRRRRRRLILLPSSFFLAFSAWNYGENIVSLTLKKLSGKKRKKIPALFFPWPDLRFKRIYQEITESTNKPPRSDARRHHFFSQL